MNRSNSLSLIIVLEPIFVRRSLAELSQLWTVYGEILPK
jgi:hypothetical protein